MSAPRQEEHVDGATGLPRHRRLRRLVRVASAVVALALALVVVLLIALHTPPAKRYVLKRIVDALAGQRIELAATALDYNLLSLSATLDDVTLRSTTAADTPPLSRAKQLSVDLSLLALLRGRYVMESGAIVDPDVHVFVGDDGRDNLPHPEPAANEPEPPTDEAAAAIDYLIRHFAITNGRLRYEDRQQQLDVQLPLTSLTVDGDDRTGAHTVQLSTTPGRFALRDRVLEISRLDADARVQGESIQIGALNLEADGSAMTATGSLTSLAEPRGDLTITTQLDLRPLADFAGAPEPIGGIVQATVHASGPLAALQVEATLDAKDLAYRSLKPMRLVAEGSYDAAGAEARLSSLEVTGAAGTLHGSGTVALAAGGVSSATATLRDVNIPAIADALKLDYRAASVVDGELRAAWPGVDYTQATGDAMLVLASTTTAAPRGAVPVEGTIAAAARPDAIDVDVRTLRAFGATVDGRVSLVQRSQLGGTLRTRTGDVASVVANVERFLGHPRGSLVPTRVAGALGVDAAFGGTIDAPRVDAALDAPALTAGTVDGIAAHVRATYTPALVTLSSADVTWDTATVHAQGTVGLDDTQTLALTATADEVSIAPLLAALDQEAIPASGIVDLKATISGTTRAPRGAAMLDATELAAYGETIGALSLRAALDGRRVELSELQLDKPQAEGNGSVRGRGSFHLDEQRYSLQLDGHDLRLEQLTLPDGRRVRGGIEIAANSAGTVEDPTGTATVALRALAVDDQQFGDVVLDVNVANREARLGARADRFKLTADARVATPAPHAATANVTIDDLDFSTLPLPPDTPITGRVTVHASGAGDLATPVDASATATIDTLAVTWNDQPIALDGPAFVRYADQRVAIDWLSLRASESLVSLYGTLPLDPAAETGALQLDARADLESLATYAPDDLGLTASGAVALTGSIEGTLQRIDPTLTLRIENASIGMPQLQQPVTNVDAQVDVADGLVRISTLAAGWGSAWLTAGGSVPLSWLPPDLPIEVPRPDGAAELQVSLAGLDLATVPGAPPELTGYVSAKADAQAATPDIGAVTGQLTFPDLQVAFGELTLAQQSPSTIGIADGRVAVEQFALQGTAGTVQISGGAGLVGEQPIDAAVRADLDLSAVGSLSKSVAAAGRVALDVAAAGTMATPAVSGFAEVRDGRVSVDDPQIAATGVNLRIDLTPERVDLSRLDARLNGGTVTGSGGVSVAGTTFSNLDLRVSAQDVALDVPLNLRSLSKADITVTQRQATSGEGEIVIGGQVTIDEAGLTDDINLDTGVLQALTAPRPLDLTESRNPLLERVRFDVKVDTANPVVVDNNLARAEIGIDVRLLGTPYETGLSGRLDLAEGSELILNERRYQVQRGIVTFIDDRSIRPSLDLVLETRARNYDISITASGLPEDTKTSLTSVPSLPEPDIMALLVTGRTLDEMRGEEIDVAKGQVMSYLGGRAGSQLGRGLQKATGLSSVKVEPNLIAAETDPGARLTVGQDLAEDLRLVYSTDLVNSSDNMWFAEYDVTRQFTTRAVRQSDATYRFDFRHDVKFGGEPEPNRSQRPKQKVGTVTLDGAPALPEDEIRRRFRLRPGKRYDFFRLREGVQRVTRLYAEHDYLQARVRVERQVRGEEVDLTLRIDPGPRIALAFAGDVDPDAYQKEARAIWTRGVFDAQRADDVRAFVREELAKDGYLDPAIDYDLGAGTETPRRVSFEVRRGAHFSRVTLQFEGAGGMDPKELEGVIDEQRLGPQVFTDPSTVTDLLQRFYRERGFLIAELDKPTYELDAASGTARARMVVREGPLFSIRSIETSGNQAVASEELLREIPLVTGDPFFPATAELSLTRIRQLYWAKGYNDVRPVYTLALDRDTGVVDARIAVEEGPRTVVTGIAVDGTARTTEQLVRDEMEIEEGAPLDLSALGRSRQNLYGTRAYSLVDITRDGQNGNGAAAPQEQPEPTESAAAPAEPQPDVPVTVNVAVREVQPFQIRYGVLFDTERGLGGILDVSNHNSLGHARVIGLQSRYDSQVREARLYLNQPSLRPLPVETTASTYVRAERNPATSRADAFNVDRMGVMVQQERQLWGSYVWSYGYRFERARTYEPDLSGPHPAFTNVSPLTSTLTREARDVPLDAAAGSFLSQAFSFSPRLLGSDVRFFKYFGQYFHYIPLQAPTRKRFSNEILRPRLVYAVGARIGLANGLGGQAVPLSERFLAGGSTTLRGFEQNAVGPIGLDGVPLGGEAMFVLNNELRFPLIGIVDGVVFADIGNVFENVSDFSLTDLRKSGGIGLRLRTPWLLVRLDYGFPFDRRTGEARRRFFFSIGQAF